MFDSTFYFAHRLLHRYAMDYHQLHHSIKGDKAWNAYYMHPIDSFLENTFPGFIGPLLLRFFIARSRRNIIVSTTATAMMMIPVGAVTVDPISIAAWFFYQELDNVRVHSGGDLRFLESGYHHYVHHQLYRCNYSNEWIDRLFGTYVESHNDAGVMEKKK
jgi:sterol desaturase/sphingolipid hydroxylase (fatty acid hydroxylase superfamily)